MDPNWKGNLMGICRFAASSGKCRRAMIQRHFGESPAACSKSADVLLHVCWICDGAAL